jgi:deoxyribodipyrimidine photo-lyase
MNTPIVIFWFRRDLRLEDNAGFYHALESGYPVLPVFVFDAEILSSLSDTSDRRVDYIHQALSHIHQNLKKQNAGLKTYFGNPLDIFKKLSQEYTLNAVYCNRDYEPYAIQRDKAIQEMLQQKGIGFYDFKDQVIFEKDEILKADGRPYTVFTPYARKWLSELKPEHYSQNKLSFQNIYKFPAGEIHSLQTIGFKNTDISFNLPELDHKIIQNYDKTRNYPAIDKTTKLGMALRFGTISIRTCVSSAVTHNDTWLSELIWREFFMHILFHFPQVVHQSFKPAYEFIEWNTNEKEFDLWCQGKTGYPIVDAGMRQLNQTGYMHNRVRMITASFLCKHLLINWRWGEAYFAEKLNDFDLAANNGNWQWVAGCGCDAAPYFRIFNPMTQTQKFDKELNYIKKWNPDYRNENNNPVIEHNVARQRTLAAYKKALEQSKL